MSIAPLAPCPSCARHVRADSDRCPFCATSFHATTFDVVPDQGSQRLKRAAIFAFATTVASVGCTNPQRPDTGNNIVQPYGAPPDPRPRPQPQPAPDAGAPSLDPIPIVRVQNGHTFVVARASIRRQSQVLPADRIDLQQAAFEGPRPDPDASALDRLLHAADAQAAKTYAEMFGKGFEGDEGDTGSQDEASSSRVGE